MNRNRNRNRFGSRGVATIPWPAPPEDADFVGEGSVVGSYDDTETDIELTPDLYDETETGDLLLVQSTGEIMRVLAKSGGNTVAVTRGHGGTDAAPIPNNGKVRGYRPPSPFLWDLNFEGEADADPWPLPGDVQEDSQAGYVYRVESELLRWVLDSDGSFADHQSLSRKVADMDLDGKTVLRFEVKAYRQSSASQAWSGIALSADADPGAWIARNLTTAIWALTNGYRLLWRWNTSNTIRLFVYRDVSDSGTLVGDVILNVNPAQAGGVDITITVTVNAGDVTVTYEVDDGTTSESDSVVDTNAARHTNFRVAGFSTSTSANLFSEFQRLTLEDLTP